MELDSLEVKLKRKTQWDNNWFSSDGEVAMVIKEFSRRWRQSGEKEEGYQCSGSSSQMFKCYYCDKEDHMKRNCPKWKKDFRDEKPSAVGVTEGLYPGDGGDIFREPTESPGKSKSILDSDCQFHRSLVREHFGMCQLCVISTANMANGAQSWITGVGTVRIHMFDGVVWTVTGDRHVPGLKRYLIYVGTLGTKGFRYSSWGGVWMSVKELW